MNWALTVKFSRRQVRHQLTGIVRLGDDVGIGPAPAVHRPAGNHLPIEAVGGVGADGVVLDVGDRGRFGLGESWTGHDRSDCERDETATCDGAHPPSLQLGTHELLPCGFLCLGFERPGCARASLSAL